MIEFEKQTWYNKNDTENAGKRIPISAEHLNRLENAISATMNQVNLTTSNLTNYWWKISKVVGGTVSFPKYNSLKQFYIWNSSYDKSVSIYYSDSVIVKVDESTGKSYAKLESPTIYNPSYATITDDDVEDVLINKYFILREPNTQSGETLYYGNGSTGKTYGNSNYYYGFSINAYECSIDNDYGDITYVNSTNKDAYVSGWDNETASLYEYLGVPFENSREACSISSGWYCGNGESRRLIKTSRKPKYVCLFYSNFDIHSIAAEAFSSGSIELCDDGFVAKSSANTKTYTYNYIVFY